MQKAPAAAAERVSTGVAAVYDQLVRPPVDARVASVAAVGHHKIGRERLTPCRRFPTAAAPFAHTPVETCDAARAAWRGGFEPAWLPLGRPGCSTGGCPVE
jgi:hypothetical protein